jgi:hypothetical protein
MLKLRSLFISALQDSRKNAQLEKYRFQKTKLHVFFVKLRFLQNNRKVKVQKDSKLKMKTFYQWKVLFKSHILIIYREKYHTVEKHIESLT